MVRDRQQLCGNVEFKEELLELYREQKKSEGHINNVRIKLRAIGEWEEKYGEDSPIKEEKERGKDLYSFTQDELENMLYSMKISSISNARFIRNVIETYFDFAKLKNKGNTFLNINSLLSGDKINKYVSVAKEKGKTINREELDNIVKSVYNYRDKATFELLWLGIMGDEYREIRHLRKQDINFKERTIYISETNRYITDVSDNVLKILKETIKEDEYYTNNGSEGGTQVRLFVDSDYICRGVRKNIKGEAPLYLTKGSFLQNFYKLKKFFPDKPYITAKNIYKSGMIHYFSKYLKDSNLKLSREVFNEFVQVYYSEACSDTMYYDFVRYYNIEMEKEKRREKKGE